MTKAAKIMEKLASWQQQVGRRLKEKARVLSEVKDVPVVRRPPVKVKPKVKVDPNWKSDIVRKPMMEGGVDQMVDAFGKKVVKHVVKPTAKFIKHNPRISGGIAAGLGANYYFGEGSKQNKTTSSPSNPQYKE